jgi:putative DNA primase/helicase
VHLVGDSSRGKTTALQVAASVWNGPDFVGTWRATSNGLEGAAASRNDTILILDEISECDPREIGAIVYSLGNGSGKTRASRTGGLRTAIRWRVPTLSSGERSLAAHMSECNRKTKAGQEARFFDVMATDRKYGLFDQIHDAPDGGRFADRLKDASSKTYGTAGPAFVRALIEDQRDIGALYARVRDLPAFQSDDGLEARAGGRFALIALAGELATEYGITSWVEGESIHAAEQAFQNWKRHRGAGRTEDRQIMGQVRDFLAQSGDSLFSNFDDDRTTVRDRAGYWIDEPGGRVYLFNSPGLKSACPGHDIKRILDALDSAGWIAHRDKQKRSKRYRVGGSTKLFYTIRPSSEDAA